MITRIDHVAIAVRDYEEAFRFFTGIFGAIPGAGAEGEKKYYWQNLVLGDLSRMELLAPTGRGSFLDNFLENRKGGVHHITMETPNIQQAAKSLDENNVPYFGYSDYSSNWKELFIHPRDAFGVLIQIAEFHPDEWITQEVKMPPGKRCRVREDQKGCVVDFAHPGGGTVSLDLTKEETRQLIKDLEKTL
ncbi:MAG: hypothetical protein GY754_43355 [bacterium]|nr:hypothetical protein [bacterium]